MYRKARRLWLYLSTVAVIYAVLFAPMMPMAMAGGCYTPASTAYGYSASYYYPSYSYPTYSYPTTYYSAPTYTSYTPKYEVKEVIVPKAVKAYVSPDYFSSVSDYYRDKLLVDAVSGRTQEVLKLQEQLQQLRQEMQQQRAPSAPQSYTPTQQQAPSTASYGAMSYAPPSQPSTAPQPQVSYAPQYMPQYSQGMQPTPCDMRAQQAYQQGMRAGYSQPQASYAPPSPPQNYAPQYTPQQGYYPPQQGQQPPQGYYPQQGQSTAPYGPSGTTPYGPPSTTPQQGQQMPPEAEVRNNAVPDGLQKVVGNSCIKCHGDNNGEHGGGFDLRNLANVNPDMRMKSLMLVLSNEMPKGKPLPSHDKRLFVDWVRMTPRAVATNQPLPQTP